MLSAADVAASINRIPGLEALPRTTVASNDAATITSSFGQPVEILAAVALLAGVLIAAIVLYTATVEHTRDYAVLKALGAGSLVLYGSALLQSLVLSVCGVLLGSGLAAGVAAALNTWYPVIASNLDLDLVGAVRRHHCRRGPWPASPAARHAQLHLRDVFRARGLLRWARPDIGIRSGASAVCACNWKGTRRRRTARRERRRLFPPSSSVGYHLLRRCRAAPALPPPEPWKSEPVNGLLARRVVFNC